MRIKGNIKPAGVITGLVLAVVGLFGSAAFSSNPVSASSNEGAYVAQRVGVAQVAPHDIAWTKAGTLWTGRHGAAGDVVAQMQDYAQCVTEDSCNWQWINGSGSGTGDFRWFLTGTP